VLATINKGNSQFSPKALHSIRKFGIRDGVSDVI
jgi:hypothetical protein